MNVTLPQYLYKYHPLDRDFSEIINEGGIKREKNGFDALEDILLRGKIYYSKPLYFNDPFEIKGVRTRLSAKERENITNRTVLQMRANRPADLSKSQVSKLVRDQARKQIAQIEDELEKEENGLLHRCGYITLSATHEEKLLWSHYADGHKGICLRLRCFKDKFYEENGAGRIIEVEYGDEILNREVELGSGDAFLLQASRKAVCWEYEQEYRAYKVPSDRRADDAQGNHDFNSEIVDGLFIGLRTPQEHRDRIMSIVQSANHEIAVFQATMHPEFLRLAFEELDVSKGEESES